MKLELFEFFNFSSFSFNNFSSSSICICTSNSDILNNNSSVVPKLLPTGDNGVKFF